MQDLRNFLDDLDQRGDIVRVSQAVSRELEISTMMMELEKRQQYPLVIFENVDGSDFPVMTNLLAPRQRLALAMGVEEDSIAKEFAKRIQQRRPVKVIKKAPFQENRTTGKDIDLYKLPILRHFPIDAGPYLTSGLCVANDPESGANTLGFHRMQLKGKDKLGISLHSRQRLWEYFRRAEARGENLPAAIVIGVHPNISLGSMALIPYDQGKFEAIGGLFGENLEVVSCQSFKQLYVPAYAEIVIEGEILATVREKEGPFAEFTNYACHRSTENVFQVKAINYRHNAVFHDITPGMSSEHITIVAVQREGDVLAALNRVLPNIKAVHAPFSSCGLFHCYISMKKIAEGQPMQAVYTALGVDHNIKMVVVVDEDVDVFDEREVLWAMATRLQADKGVLIVPQHMGMGCTLDPSSDEQSRTAKMGIDATKPMDGFSPRIVMDEAVTENIKRLFPDFGLRS